MLNRRVNQEWIILWRKVDISGKVTLEQGNRCIRLHFQKVVFILPNERNVFEFLQVVPLHWLGWTSCSLSWLVVGEQEVVNQLLSPFDDTFYHVEWQHSQRMKDVQTLVKQLIVTLLVLSSHLIHTQTVQLHVFLISFLKHFFELHDLRNATFSSNNSSNSILNWGFFSLQIFNLLDNNRGILLGFETINTV